ncbi:glycosyltransferase [Gallibacterium salpingitidis]|uniref:Glycosyl transferase n=1 Tax=Gallibacterium salpingitidis TaxID=505341 RepID=A0A1A7NZZ8_9PAST|nr:glycosyltransferase [Gallibacterium salpingitidis]OBW95288.1 glycosyl transferase [Gallibacterium salpingitidis]
MKIAIIHHWLINMRGGEKVLEALCELFPDADIFTHVYQANKFQNSIISKHRIYTTFIAKLPFATKLYQSYLPIMPLALEELDLSEYELIISIESGPAKGIIPAPGVPHICYCNSPMRYVWDMYAGYKLKMGRFKRFISAPLFHYIRRWDQLTSQQVTSFIANSHFISDRIKSYYGRTSEVIYPPVNIDEFELSDHSEDYYLMLGQLVSYKRVDLAVNAFNQTGKKLIIIGEGEQLDTLKSIAKPNIQFLGYQPTAKVKEYLMKCKALIFPGIEDFGIVPVEAMACGKPVIAFAKGGALDSVINDVTGILFHPQTENSLNDAVLYFEKNIEKFNPNVIRKHALSFSKEAFKIKIQNHINNVINQ